MIEIIKSNIEYKYTPLYCPKCNIKMDYLCNKEIGIHIYLCTKCAYLKQINSKKISN